MLQPPDIDRPRAVIRRPTAIGGAVALGAAGVALAATPAGAVVLHAVSGVSQRAAANQLTPAKAVVLGIVEGITEWLPISSTGHLHVAERILNVGTTKATKDAADNYAITIQAGAILAVLFLYTHRVRTMIDGLRGRDPAGRRLLIAVAIAFVPSALVGVVFEKPIKDKLFGAWPIVVAWIVGGIFLLVLAPRLRELGRRGAALETITPRQAIIVGLAQVLALWPGTSRSLVTIVAALFLGLGIAASVEFSFLLGLVTLSAATAYTALKHGKEMIDTYGLANPLIGLVVAFVFAAVAIKWMVTYLQRHDLSIFGWYRLAIAAVTIVLLATNAI
ncbi:MAG: bacitracin resistance protein baca [Actinomycetia bacterium]|nr:bacitracin resistance protein baca [Actinomycetes bacterium]